MTTPLLPQLAVLLAEGVPLLLGPGEDVPLLAELQLQLLQRFRQLHALLPHELQLLLQVVHQAHEGNQRSFVFACLGGGDSRAGAGQSTTWAGPGPRRA